MGGLGVCFGFGRVGFGLVALAFGWFTWVGLVWFGLGKALDSWMENTWELGRHLIVAPGPGLRLHQRRRRRNRLVLQCDLFFLGVTFLLFRMQNVRYKSYMERASTF